MVLELFHDDDAEIYVNGTRILSVERWNNYWEELAVDPQVFFAAAHSGKNTLAVKMSQRFGEQYFDLGLKLEIRKLH